MAGRKEVTSPIGHVTCSYQDHKEGSPAAVLKYKNYDLSSGCFPFNGRLDNFFERGRSTSTSTFEITTASFAIPRPLSPTPPPTTTTMVREKIRTLFPAAPWNASARSLALVLVDG